MNEGNKEIKEFWNQCSYTCEDCCFLTEALFPPILEPDDYVPDDVA